MGKLTPERVALGLALFQVGDAVACAIPIATIEEALDRIGCPPAVRRVLPAIKLSAAAGLVVGGRAPVLRRATATALVAYFATAVGWHIGAKDEPLGSVPPAALGLTAAYVALGT